MDAAGLNVREVQRSSGIHGMSHRHHAQGQERRESVSPCGERQVREGEGSAVSHLGLHLTNALPPQETLTRFALEDKLARREKDLPSAYDFISNQGKKLMQGCPGKAVGKAEIQAPRASVAEAQDVLRSLSTGDVGKEAQPPWDGHVSPGQG